MFVEDEEEAEKSAQSNVILKDEEVTLYWNYTQSMLRGCGCLPIDRIHTWLKLYASQELTIEQVRFLLDTKTKEQLLKYNVVCHVAMEAPKGIAVICVNNSFKPAASDTANAIAEMDIPKGRTPYCPLIYHIR